MSPEIPRRIPIVPDRAEGKRHCPDCTYSTLSNNLPFGTPFATEQAGQNEEKETPAMLDRIFYRKTIAILSLIIACW